MTNPLIDKFYELHPEKREKLKPDYYKGEKSYAEELEELSTTSITNVNPNSVSAITAANPFPPTFKSSNLPPPTFKTYDIDSINDSFLQIAEKVKNKEAQVTSMNMDYEHQTRTQRITFEVLTNF